jgi:hypothetical protein
VSGEGTAFISKMDGKRLGDWASFSSFARDARLEVVPGLHTFEMSANLGPAWWAPPGSFIVVGPFEVVFTSAGGHEYTIAYTPLEDVDARALARGTIQSRTTVKDKSLRGLAVNSQRGEHTMNLQQDERVEPGSPR